MIKFSFFKGSYTANCSPLTSLFVIILCMLLIQLGLWQQHRAQWKKTYLEYQKRQSAQKPITLAQFLSQHPEKPDFLPLKLQGYFDNSQTHLLDNRYRDHHVGFEVLTPFFDMKAHEWILINRGWISSTSTHNPSEPILALKGMHPIEGTLHIPSKKGIILGNNKRETHPPVIQQIRLTSLNDMFKHPLLPLVLRLTPLSYGSYDCHWPPITTLSPAQHYAYAFQWYTLALTLFICYLAAIIKRGSI